MSTPTGSTVCSVAPFGTSTTTLVYPSRLIITYPPLPRYAAPSAVLCRSGLMRVAEARRISQALVTAHITEYIVAQPVWRYAASLAGRPDMPVGPL